MTNSTPEYVAAHLSDLADKPPKAGSELIARYRAERRRQRSQRIGRLVATISRALPFVRSKSGGEVMPNWPESATR